MTFRGIIERENLKRTAFRYDLSWLSITLFTCIKKKKVKKEKLSLVVAWKNLGNPLDKN